MQTLTRILALTVTVVLIPATAMAQTQARPRPDLHVDHRWEECSFQLHASLTPDAWRQFTREAGLVTHFRPLVDARPMGRGKYEFSALQWKTAIDDRDSAWNDTFVHPDSTHWLFEGSGLAFPGLMLRRGMTDKLDVGAYFTKNPKANYGFYGGQVQYTVVQDTARKWAASARASVVSMFGPEDLGFTTVGLDAVASRTFTATRWAAVSPYVGVSHYLANAWEKSDVVSLDAAHETGSQAYIGAVARVSILTIAAEYNAAKVSSKSLKVGVSF